jgi:hypothetical protein
MKQQTLGSTKGTLASPLHRLHDSSRPLELVLIFDKTLLMSFGPPPLLLLSATGEDVSEMQRQEAEAHQVKTPLAPPLLKHQQNLVQH